MTILVFSKLRLSVGMSVLSIGGGAYDTLHSVSEHCLRRPTTLSPTCTALHVTDFTEVAGIAGLTATRVAERRRVIGVAVTVVLTRLRLAADRQLQHERLLRADASTTSLVVMSVSVLVFVVPRGRSLCGRAYAVLGRHVERRDWCEVARTEQSVDGFGRHLVRFAYDDAIVVMDTATMLRQLPAPGDVTVRHVTSTPSCANDFHSEQTRAALYVMTAHVVMTMVGNDAVRVGAADDEDIDNEQHHTPRDEPLHVRPQRQHFSNSRS